MVSHNTAFCLWDGCATSEHCVIKDSLKCNTFTLGQSNIKHAPLDNLQHVIVSPLHIKLELTKNFVKILNKGG